jgi:hypothetical protein
MALAENQTTGGVFKALGVAIDGEALLQERFEYETLPFGLEVLEAHELASGDRLVSIGRPEGTATPEGQPHTIVVMFHKKAFAAKLKFSEQPIKASPEKLGEWKGNPKKTFRTEISRGRVDFDEWEALYIRERLYRDTGEWVDSLRVNLSSSELFVVLFAEFMPEVDAQEAIFAELLDGMELRDGELVVE